MEDHEIALLNEPEITTRRGNRATRDTTPELTWLSDTLDVTWTKEDADLWSDHSVIGITIRGSRYQAVLGKARITDWDQMRNFIQNQEEASEEESKRYERKQTYIEWARDQKKALQKLTQEIATSQAPYVDARPTNMWAALQSLLEDLKVKFLKTEKSHYPVPERYNGPYNEKLGRPFTMTEMCGQR
ncbi:hypothetical protein MRX96_017054 [Rhipicephalus microplus]